MGESIFALSLTNMERVSAVKGYRRFLAGETSGSDDSAYQEIDFSSTKLWDAVEVIILAFMLLMFVTIFNNLFWEPVLCVRFISCISMDI